MKDKELKDRVIVLYDNWVYHSRIKVDIKLLKILRVKKY